MNKAVLTVLIPTIDRAESCQRAIESVLAQIEGLPVQLVVSDNASEQSDKLEFLQNLHRLYPGITLLTRTTRLNPVEHFRQIIENVNSEYLVILADDDSFGPDLIPEFFQTLNEIEFDVFKPKWVLSYLGVERKYSKTNFLESRSISLKLYAFFVSPDDSLFYSIVRTRLLTEHIRKFPEQWSSSIGRQPFWAYHVVIYLICYSRLRNAQKPLSTWVNLEGNSKVELKNLEYYGCNPNQENLAVLSGKRNSFFDSLAKILEFQLYLNKVLVSVHGVKWLLASSVGSFLFLLKRSLAKLRFTHDS